MNSWAEPFKSPCGELAFLLRSFVGATRRVARFVLADHGIAKYHNAIEDQLLGEIIFD